MAVYGPHAQILHHEPNPNLVVRIRESERAAHQAAKPPHLERYSSLYHWG